MPVDTLYLIILVVTMLLAFASAVGAVLAGFWLAGRLSGLFGRPTQVVSPYGVTGLGDAASSDNGDELESVPWLDDAAQSEGDDPGDDPDNWDEARG